MKRNCETPGSVPFKKKCSVPCCTDKKSSQHRFPKNEPAVFKTWLKNINNPALQDISDDDIYKKYRVCDRHFNPHDKVPGRRGLKRMACPMLHLSDSTGTDEIEVSFEEHTISPISVTLAVTHDHNYGRSEECVDDELRIASAPCSGSSRDDCKTPEDQKLTLAAESSRRGVLKEVSLTRKTYLTPKAAILYKKVIDSQNKMAKLSRKVTDFKKRLNFARKFSEQATFCNLMEHVNESTYTFILSQIRTQHQKPKGRRFTIDEKVLALTILKASGRGYRLLSKIFSLPSRKTLLNVLNKIPIDTGINKSVLETLKKSVDTMAEKHKLCVLMFDEMYLSSELHYNRKYDRIDGLQDDGTHRTPGLADYVNVFLVRGVNKQWKQPLSFTFSCGPTKSHQLKNLIKANVVALQEIGLTVVATICDQGGSNTAAINMLLKDTKEAYLRTGQEKRNFGFELNNKEIVPIYDIPHLFKGLRNNLLTKDLHFELNGNRKVAKWEHIENFYFLDRSEDVRICPKLTDQHVLRKNIKKMKVKNCTQVFSYQVGSLMKRISRWNNDGLPPEAADTADLILFLDKLFDSLNGSQVTAPVSKPVKGALTKNSIHEEYWKTCLKTLHTMKYFFKKKQKFGTVPSIRNLRKSIRGFLYVKRKLLQNKNDYFLLRHWQQDALENFFGSIRSYGYRNNSPSVQYFVSSFKSLIVNNFTSRHSPESNCEEDNHDGVLNNLKSFVNLNLNIKSIPVNIQDIEIPKAISLKKKSKISRNVITYVAGFILKKYLKTATCAQCRNYVLFRHDDTDTEFIDAREYENSKLTRPGSFFTYLISDSLSRLFYLIPRLCHYTNISLVLEKILLSQISFNLITCSEHQKDSVVLCKYVVRCILHFWCKKVNSVAKGKDEKFVRFIASKPDPIFVDPVMLAAHKKLIEKKKRFKKSK